MKRRNFVLFEVLIGFALVCIAILPFVRYPFEHMRKEIDLLFDMELEKIAQNHLAETQVKLYKNEIDARWIFTKEEKKRQVSNDKIQVEFSKQWKRNYIKKVFITWERQKLSDDRLASVLLNIEVQYLRQDKVVFTTQSKVLAQKKI